MGKKKSKKKVAAPKPVKMPEKAREQWGIIQQEQLEIMRQMKEVSARGNLFLRGMRLAFNIPDDWGFDPRLLAFTPPKKEKGDGKD